MDTLRELLLLSEEMASRRGGDPLLAYKPSEKQNLFIDSVLTEARQENWLIAANRCVTPWTPVETGSATRLIGEVLGERGFYVRSWDGGSRCTRRASGLFLKGIEPAFRCRLDNGGVFEASRRHRVLTPAGWASLGSLLSIRDDRRWMGTGGGLPASCGGGDRRYDRRLPLDAGSGTGGFRPGGDVRPPARPFGHGGGAGPGSERIRACLELFPRATPDDPDRLAALFGLWTGSGGGRSGQRLSDERSVGRQSAGESGPVPAAAGYQGPPGLSEASEPVDRWLPCSILLAGGAKLIAYQEIGLQPIVDFTVEGTHNWVSEGVIHHNSGKSDAGAYCGATLARWGNDNARYIAAKGSRIEIRDRATAGWVVGLDFPILRDTIQPKYFDNGFVPPGGRDPFIPAREIEEWRTTDQVLRLKNGSIIGFKSVDSGRTKFQSAERDWVHFDEEPPEDIYQETTIRVGTRPLRILGTVTLLPPQGQVGGVSWMFPKIIQPWSDGKLPDVALFKASIYDNPYIPVDEIRRLESRYPPGSTERRIRLEGEWLPGLSGARAYPAFNRLVNVRAVAEPDHRRPVVWMMDFNVEPMCSLIGYRGVDRVFRVWRELVLEQGDLYSMVQMFHEILPTHGAELWIYGDATSRSRSRQTGQSDYQLIMNMMRGYGVPVRLRVPETNPAVPDRINAVQRACRDEDGVVRVEIDPSCQELVADMEQVLRDPSGGIKKSRNPKDAYFKRTHTSDALGYWISYEEPVRAARIGETRKVNIPSPAYSLQKLGIRGAVR